VPVAILLRGPVPVCGNAEVGPGGGEGEPMDAGGIGNVVLTGGKGLPEGPGRAGTPAMPSMPFQFVHRDMLHTVPVFPEDHHLSITTPENSPVPW
jgi:hypothetical protein